MALAKNMYVHIYIYRFEFNDFRGRFQDLKRQNMVATGALWILWSAHAATQKGSTQKPPQPPMSVTRTLPNLGHSLAFSNTILLASYEYRKTLQEAPPHIRKNMEKWDEDWETLSGWWFQPIWQILVKLDHFPRDPGENKTCLKPPPSCFKPSVGWSSTLVKKPMTWTRWFNDWLSFQRLSLALGDLQEIINPWGVGVCFFAEFASNTTRIRATSRGCQ